MQVIQEIKPSNPPVKGGVSPPPSAQDLPRFDLHAVEAALGVSHLIFGGAPMTREQIAVDIQEYRMFLQRHKMAGMPEKFEKPTFAIDRIWHTHMCETAQYAADCRAYFGKFFHHANGMCTGDGDGTDLGD